MMTDSVRALEAQRDIGPGRVGPLLMSVLNAQHQHTLDLLLPLISDTIKPHRWDLDYPESAPPLCRASVPDSFYAGVLHAARVVREAGEQRG